MYTLILFRAFGIHSFFVFSRLFIFVYSDLKGAEIPVLYFQFIDFRLNIFNKTPGLLRFNFRVITENQFAVPACEFAGLFRFYRKTGEGAYDQVALALEASLVGINVLILRKVLSVFAVYKSF